MAAGESNAKRLPPLPSVGGALISSGADAAPLKMAHSRAETIYIADVEPPPASDEG